MSERPIDSAVPLPKMTRVRSTKSKPAPKAPDNNILALKASEQKKTSTSEANDQRPSINSKQSNENEPPDPSIKSKKKRAPKIEVKHEPGESAPMATLVKTRKTKAPRRPSGKEVLLPLQTIPDSFENLPVIHPNDVDPTERAIIDVYSGLASKINFSAYVGSDQWCVVHWPKSARTETKSRRRKRLPGAKKVLKATQSKTSLFHRLRTGVNTLVHNDNNLVFGEQPNDHLTCLDDLHHYAQQLRELEDAEREIYPEYLVLRDGKAVYGVHESDADGQMKLVVRKPIYDRSHGQQPDESVEKRKLLARLKLSFQRHRNSGSQVGEPLPSASKAS